jgi:Na+/proline symporter
LSNLLILGLAAGYVGLLFLIAWRVDRPGHRPLSNRLRPTVHALSLAIYCTSWT